MSYNFLPYEPDQLLLLPPALQDWVGQDSLARFVSELVERFDREGRLAPFYRRYRDDGWGRAAHHPMMMIKLLLYGYCTGVVSSRKLSQATEEMVTFRFLAADNHPDHRPLNEFRREHLDALQGLFVEVLALCQEAGLVQLGRVALDGRKVAGNAALDRNRDEAWLKEEVRKLLEESERVDAEEEARYGERRGDELPGALADSKKRQAILDAALARIAEKKRAAAEEQERKIGERERQEAETGRKKRGRKPKDPGAAAEEVGREVKANLTDPDSRIMKKRTGWVQGYNGQAMADCASQVIVACELTQDENDVGQLEPMLDRCAAQAGELPDELLADAGYWSESNVPGRSDPPELFIATTKDRKQRQALRDAPPPRGRIPKKLSARDRMERKLRTKRGRAAYRERGMTIEPVFGQMETRGLRRFLLRGLAKAKMEWFLWCTTHNILKLWRSRRVAMAA